jgi:hypothetical protein
MTYPLTANDLYEELGQIGYASDYSGIYPISIVFETEGEADEASNDDIEDDNTSDTDESDTDESGADESEDTSGTFNSDWLMPEGGSNSGGNGGDNPKPPALLRINGTAQA